MKDISVILPQSTTNIEILLLGDGHRGSKQFNEKLFLETVNYIKNTPNCYCIVNGDLLDNAIKNSKSNVHLAVESPQESMNWIVDTLKPLAEKEKILAIGPGNHEERTERETGTEPTWWIARCLGIEERYFSGIFILYVSMGRNRNRVGKYHTFAIVGGHGAGGGGTPQSASKKLIDLAQIVVNADVYVMNHFHQQMWVPRARYVTDVRTKKHYFLDPLLVMGNAFLDFEGSYAETKMYQPSSKRVPIIELHTGFDWKRAELKTTNF